jgi:non-homologous end joining protein Ku
VRAMLDAKVKGSEITVSPSMPLDRRVIDLMEALKQSMKPFSAETKEQSRRNVKGVS